MTTQTLQRLLDFANRMAACDLTNGPRHFGLLLSSADAVLQLEPDLAALRLWMMDAGISGVGMAAVAGASTGSGLIKRSNREARAFGLATPAAVDVAQTAEPQVEVRFFANDVMVNEDPVTGSFNASLAQWLIADGLAPTHYTVTQGTCLGRLGQVHIEQDAGGQVWVGGESVTCIDGHVRL